MQAIHTQLKALCAYMHTYMHTCIHAHKQLKALSAYGWRGTITRKKEDGAVELLADVDTCGLNPKTGIKGITDPDNVKSYKALETLCASNPKRRAFLAHNFSLRKHDDQSKQGASATHMEEPLQSEGGVQSDYQHGKHESNVQEGDASQPASDTTIVYDAPVVQSSSRTSLDYPFSYDHNQWLTWEEGQQSSVIHTATSNSSKQLSTSGTPEFNWEKVVSSGRGGEHAAVLHSKRHSKSHSKRRQADIASSIPKTAPDVNLTDPSDEVRYIDLLGPEKGYPNLVHR
jgi:hypothetical protein